MNNSSMIHEQSEIAASALLQRTVDQSDETKVEKAFQLSLGRKPTGKELELAMALLRAKGDQEGSDEPAAWAALQRGLFACVDFRFLR